MNKRDLIGLSVKQFTFALLGRDTEHYRTDIDDIINFDNFGYSDIAIYLREVSENWDNDILRSLKDDMNHYLDEFIGWHTSVSLPIEFENQLVGTKEETTPKYIVWTNRHGRQVSISYDGVEIYDDLDSPIDWFELINMGLIEDGTPPGLDMWALARYQAIKKRDLFVKLQRKHFEEHTLYTYAVKLINRHIDGNNPINVSNGKVAAEVCLKLEPLSLPSELDTERARVYFTRAVEVGYMQPTQTGYKWVFGGERGALVRLGYFVERVFCPTNTEELPEQAINRLFGVNRIGSAITQRHNAKKPQKWQVEIDNKIFFD